MAPMTPFAELFGSGNTTITDLIDKTVANYRALLEKHFGEFDAEALQTVLRQPELATEQFDVFRRLVEAVSNSKSSVEDSVPKDEGQITVDGFRGFDPEEYDPYDLQDDPFEYTDLR